MAIPGLRVHWPRRPHIRPRQVTIADVLRGRLRRSAIVAPTAGHVSLCDSVSVGDLPSGTVTFLFTDIEGSTRLWEERRNEMEQALAEHDSIVRGAIESNGGYVFATGGDGFAAAFGSAADAVAAAQQSQAALDGDGFIRVRMGIHTGEVQERDGDYFGPAVNQAARIMDAGHGGQVLLSEVSAVLVEADCVDLGEHSLSGISGLVGIRQLGETDFPAIRAGPANVLNLPVYRTSLIGRDELLASIRSALTPGSLVTLTGVGGVGKTRLAVEVADKVRVDFPSASSARSDRRPTAQVVTPPWTAANGNARPDRDQISRTEYGHQTVRSS
jgi:class 3 adenylate cyclase